MVSDTGGRVPRSVRRDGWCEGSDGFDVVDDGLRESTPLAVDVEGLAESRFLADDEDGL